MTKDALGKQLVALRRQAGLTQVEVAARLGSKQATVSTWEVGTHEPDLEMIEAYARACGTTARLVFGDLGSPLQEAAAALGEKDVELVTQLVEVLARAEGERGIRIRGMLDGIIGVEARTASAPRARSSLG